jgi:1-acyl-sn-glycerol-3-phosphate acyltransferase
MKAAEAVWGVGRVTLQPAVKLIAPLRVYGVENLPREGGVVLALNHFSWLDPLEFGAASPRVIYYMAKIELHRVRGESDREAVRMARTVVREGNALGLFVEGTRQRSGVPGEVKAGASMVALQERVPVVPAAIHGSQYWRRFNFHPVSVAWGNPLDFGGLPANGKGYREASAEIARSIRTLWEFLIEMHEHGRPPAKPPRLVAQSHKPARQ